MVSAEVHLNLLASLSDSRRVRMSPSRTGPLTFRIIWRLFSLRNSTFTWVHWPCEPVRPKIFVTCNYNKEYNNEILVYKKASHSRDFSSFKSSFTQFGDFKITKNCYCNYCSCGTLQYYSRCDLNCDYRLRQIAIFNHITYI